MGHNLSHLNSCDNAQPGSFCEGDGKCGTRTDLFNCNLHHAYFMGVWKYHGYGTVCRRDSRDQTTDGHGTVVRMPKPTKYACKLACEHFGAGPLLESNNYDV